MAKETLTVDEIMKQMNKEAGSEIVHKGKAVYDTPRIPFSSPRMNYMTYGGIPMNKLTEFYGDEHSGKTTSAIDIAANYQKMEGARMILYADMENTLDYKWATVLGLDVESELFRHMQPTSQSAEYLFQKILDLMSTGEIGLVIIDSFGVMVSQSALEKSIEDKTMCGISSALTNFSKQAETLCQKHGVTMIGINQMRDNINSPYGGTVTTGGKAWKHNCSCRIEFRHGQFFDEKYKPLSKQADGNIGNFVEAYMSKNKTCPADRHVGSYTIKYLSGIDATYDLVDLLKDKGYIAQRGSVYDIIDPITGEVYKSTQGMAKLCALVTDPENKEVQDMLTATLTKLIEGDM